MSSILDDTGSELGGPALTADVFLRWAHSYYGTDLLRLSKLEAGSLVMVVHLYDLFVTAGFEPSHTRELMLWATSTLRSWMNIQPRQRIADGRLMPPLPTDWQSVMLRYRDVELVYEDGQGGVFRLNLRGRLPTSEPETISR